MARCFLILSAVAVVALSACASGPKVVTSPPTALPSTAPTYRLMASDPAAADHAVLAAVRTQLDAQGWRETREAPVWRIEAAYAVHPQKTGAYSDVSAREGDWLDAPVLPQWWSGKRGVHTLTLVLHGPDASPRAYQSSAATTVSTRRADEALALLASAAVAELKPAP